MRLVLVSPAWRRYEVTRLALAQRAHLQGVLAGRGLEMRVVVVADDDNLDLAAEYGFDTVEQNNDHVGRKFNDGLEYAFRDLEADYAGVIGSDDWLHEDLFDRLPRSATPMPEPSDEEPAVVWRDAPEAISGRTIAVVELASGRMKLRRDRGRYGVVPYIFPRAALEPSGFRPVRDDLSKGLDGSMVSGLKCRPNWVFRDPHDFCRVDFKSGTNITAYDRVTTDKEFASAWTMLAQHYPSPLVAMARDLHDRMLVTA